MNKKQLKALASRYKEAYNTILNQYPAWKRNAVIEDTSLNKDTSFLQGFIKDIIHQVESAELDLMAENATVNRKKAKTKQTQTV